MGCCSSVVGDNGPVRGVGSSKGLMGSSRLSVACASVGAVSRDTFEELADLFELSIRVAST